MLYCRLIIIITCSFLANLQTTSGNTSKTASVGPRITNGVDVKENEAPWMVFIHVGKDKNNLVSDSICGGVLINSLYVLTSALCVSNNNVEKPEDIHMVIGYTNYSTGLKNSIHAISYTTHPFFKSIQNIYVYDFALIKLPFAIHENDNIKFCEIIPSKYLNQLDFFANKRVAIFGWGPTVRNLDDDSFQEVPTYTLKRGVVKILSSEECTFIMDIVDMRVDTNNHLCADTIRKTQGACMIDIGGPAMIRVKSVNKYYLIGVISFTLGCETPVPNILSRINEHVYDWIKFNTVN